MSKVKHKSYIVAKHTWYFVTEVVPSTNERAAILALPIASKLLIMSFSYFGQSLHHVKFTIICPVVGCTLVCTPKMPPLLQLLNASMVMEFHFSIFNTITRTVLINFLMFGKENELKKILCTPHFQDNCIKKRCRQCNRKAIRQHKCC